MKSLFALGFAAVYGLIVRYLFGFFNGFYEIMSLAMMALAPFAVGFLTVILTDQKKIGGYAGAFFRPWGTSLILLMVTILLSMEGIICWVMIYPFFSIVAGIGGVVARFYALRRQQKNDNTDQSDILDDLDRPDILRLSPLLMLPLVVGALEGDHTQISADYTVTRQIIIDAPAQTIWQALVNVPEIDPDTPQGWTVAWLGLPRHLRTVTDSVAIGGARRAYYERGLFFEETIQTIQPDQSLTVSIKADPGSVPPTVLDDHLVIGGKHFKALKDTYTITRLPDGRCQLTLSADLRISTPINWYAGLWARWVVSDILDVLLEVIQRRCVRK